MTNSQRATRIAATIQRQIDRDGVIPGSLDDIIRDRCDLHTGQELDFVQLNILCDMVSARLKNPEYLRTI